MTEKEKLESYITDGFKTHMVIRTMSVGEIKLHLPEAYWDKEVFSLPLWREDNKKIMFFFIDKETKEYAQALIKVGGEVIGFHLIIYVSVLSDEAVGGRIVHFESVIDSLKEVKGWDVRSSKNPNIFEIHFDINTSERQKVEQAIKEVGEILLLLTLKNKKGFHIEKYSSGERYRHQPFSANVGLEETMLIGISKKDIEKHVEILKNSKFIEALNALRLIYSQINKIAKITICWVTIEDLFGHSKPEHMLSNEEINTISTAINSTELGEKKKSFLIHKVRDSSFFAVKTRNLRIAENIADLLNQDVKVIKKRIKEISIIRGKLVHKIHADDIDIQPQLQFTESILLTYLDSFNL